MANHISWGSIELLHNVIRTQNHFAAIPLEEGGRPLPKITYRSKVKLHGVNCGIQITSDGIFYQSRTIMLTPKADYKGFARWASSHTNYFEKLQQGITVFGEWAGPGIEKGMAISAAKSKVFVVFAIQVGHEEAAQIIFEPTEIQHLLGDNLPESIHILPWWNEPIVVDFASQDSLAAVAAEINKQVEAVEKEDPWVKTTFGLSGLGEGVVLYPVNIEGGQVPTHPEALATYMWKAKGEGHRTAGTKEAVQVDASVVATSAEFVDLMVTEPRLMQGLTEVCEGERNPKFTGKFITWITADVKKESEAELEASGLTWNQVEKAIQTRAREWFLKK